MATRSTNTMAEALQRLHADVAQMKVLPDADLAFVTELETMIVGYLRGPIDQMQAAGQLPPGGPPPPQIPPTQTGGLMGQSPMPNPDELRRIIQVRQ